MPRTVFLSFFLLFPLVATACAGIGGSGKPAVLATTTQIHDFAKNVGGDRLEIVGLIGPDVDAHDYEPTAEDARKIARAKLILTNGFDLEGEWLPALLKNADSKTPVVEMSKGITALRGAEGEDPHIWFDVQNAKLMVQSIRDAFIQIDSAGADQYRKNTTAYLQQLDALDSEIKQQIATIPAANRKLVTNHDAFGYYVRAYGLTFVGSVLPSLNTDSQPSAAEIARLIQAIRTQQVKAIFTESSIDPKLEQQIAAEAGVKVYSTLYSDSLGPAGSEGDTYIKMMRYDTKTIVDGLK